MAGQFVKVLIADIVKNPTQWGVMAGVVYCTAKGAVSTVSSVVKAGTKGVKKVDAVIESKIEELKAKKAEKEGGEK